MKKALALVLAVVMVLSLCACTPAGGNTDNPGNNGGQSTTPNGGSENNGGTGEVTLAGTYQITVWCAENAVELTKSQIEKFNSTNTDGIVIEATIEAVSEADAGTNMITDVEAGGDLYCFAQDQFARLVQAGALAKLGQGATQIVSEANDPGVVAAATVGEELFAYPMTADNGYFMYYDASVVPEADVDSMEAIIADCEAAGKYFAFEMNTSAWYLASFFFATGCVSEWTTDSDGKFVSVNDNFNSANGLIAVKGMEKLVKSPMYLSSSKGAEFASGAAVVVTGIWDYETVKGILGDNMGVTDLPSFEVDGTSYHLGSFNGCKLMGVKPQTDPVRQAVLHKLAQYLTSEECQMERFETLAWGPSNSNAQKSDAVQANPGLAALLAQSPYSIPQGQIHGSWWDIAKVIGDDVKAAEDEAGLQKALDNYQEKIDSLFTMSDEVMNAFTVIGAINGDGWTIDLPMTADGDVWTTTEAYAMDAGTEFKVRKGKSWDEAYPAENFVVETAGTYYVQFNAATGEVSLVEG
ncbi:MAG: extracellular solute-binding protein [Faecousia sp.]